MRLPLAVLLAVLAGCAGGRTILMKNEQGQIAQCQVSGASAALTGSYLRNIELRKCIEQYQAVGYQRVDGDKPLPLFDLFE